MGAYGFAPELKASQQVGWPAGLVALEVLVVARVSEIIVTDLIILSDQCFTG